jgi:uncharacterized membrane protein (DUF2068 family)
VGTFPYAGLFAIEGFGVLLRKRWAEYFTIVTPGGLIPLEIYELPQHFTVPKLVVALVKHADRLVPGSARAVALRRFSRSPNLPK